MTDFKYKRHLSSNDLEYVEKDLEPRYRRGDEEATKVLFELSLNEKDPESALEYYHKISGKNLEEDYNRLQILADLFYQERLFDGWCFCVESLGFLGNENYKAISECLIQNLSCKDLNCDFELIEKIAQWNNKATRNFQYHYACLLNEPEKTVWLQNAAKNGHAGAQYELGKRCEERQNYAEAETWLQRAAQESIVADKKLHDLILIKKQGEQVYEKELRVAHEKLKLTSLQKKAIFVLVVLGFLGSGSVYFYKNNQYRDDENRILLKFKGEFEEQQKKSLDAKNTRENELNLLTDEKEKQLQQNSELVNLVQNRIQTVEDFQKKQDDLLTQIQSVEFFKDEIVDKNFYEFTSSLWGASKLNILKPLQYDRYKFLKILPQNYILSADEIKLLKNENIVSLPEINKKEIERQYLVAGVHNIEKENVKKSEIESILKKETEKYQNEIVEIDKRIETLKAKIIEEYQLKKNRISEEIEKNSKRAAIAEKELNERQAADLDAIKFAYRLFLIELYSVIVVFIIFLVFTIWIFKKFNKSKFHKAEAALKGKTPWDFLGGIENVEYKVACDLYSGSDRQTAVEWFRKAAEHGNVDAQLKLGNCYYDGLGILENKTEAVNWYRKAAEEENAQAQFNLANCYDNGYGVPINREEALKWFKKAADKGNADALNYLKPVQMVKIPNRNWLIGKYQITQKEYKTIMGENPSRFKGNGTNPVECVSWKEAMDFCKKLTAREHALGRLPDGYKYTLPTSKQWEFACRAGTTSKYCSGDIDASLFNVAWWKVNSGNKTHPVGEKDPNTWGIYDMHGNVWEWCLDVSSQNESHVCRGGGYCAEPFLCGSSFVNYYVCDSRYDYLGFRVALVPTTKTEALKVVEQRNTQVQVEQIDRDKNNASIVVETIRLQEEEEAQKRNDFNANQKKLGAKTPEIEVIQWEKKPVEKKVVELQKRKEVEREKTPVNVPIQKKKADLSVFFWIGGIFWLIVGFCCGFIPGIGVLFLLGAANDGPGFSRSFLGFLNTIFYTGLLLLVAIVALIIIIN